MKNVKDFAERLRQSARFHYVWRSYFFDKAYAAALGLAQKAEVFACRSLLVYMLALAALVGVNGASRAAGYPLPWTEELSAWLIVGLCFSGSSVALRRGLHVGITIFVELAPAHVRRLLVFTGNLLVALFRLLAIGAGFLSGFAAGGKTGAEIPLPLALPYLQMPLWGILIFVQILPFLAGPVLKNTQAEEFLLTRIVAEE
ncbi:MAG: TRAP transporter small permease [Spirochaetales bacterium]|nr:TRAP transporter small permease [Spirochaetales bacterium]